MIRNLKALGLALVAVFAFSALAATSASAGTTTGKITADENVTLTGTETGTLLQNAFTAGEAALGSITCDGSTYTGHAINWTPHTLLAPNATEVTITPHYVNCKAHIPLLGTRTAKVTMTECDYVFEDATTTGGVDGTYGVKAEIKCPEGQKIHVHVLNLAETANICEITVGPGTYHGAHLKHTTGTDDDIDLEGTFTGIHEEHTGTLCGTATSNNASLHADVTIKGHNSLGNNIPVTITH